MKKIFLIMAILSLCFISSCNKKKNDDKNNNQNNNEQQNLIVPEVPKVNLSKDYYVVGEKVSFEVTNYDLDELDISIDDKYCLNDNHDYTYTVRRKGNYVMKFSLKEDPTIYKEVNLDFYAATFDIDLTSPSIGVGDSCNVWIYSYDNIYENELTDFDISVTKGKANINGYTVTSIEKGEITITLTSKLNDKVSNSINLLVADPTENLYIKPSCGINKMKVGEIVKVDVSLDYAVDEYVWLNSNKETLRVTKYDTSVEITGIKEGETRFSCYLKDDPSIKTNYFIKVEGYEDVDFVDRLIKLAYDQVGIWEGQDEFGNFNNETKFGIWYNNNGAPWCATFVSWCWFHAGLSNDLLVKYQGCTAGMQWMHEAGIFHDVKGDYYQKEDYHPKSGDIVIFLSDGGSHTGIVAYADDTYIYTIEGNRSNRVDVWRIPLNNSKITGYGSPKYPESTYHVDQSWIKTTKVGNKYLWTDVVSGLSTL